MGVRAVPTELRWNTCPKSPPKAILACMARTSSSGAPGPRSEVLIRGGADGGSSEDMRDSAPRVHGWAGRSRVVGSRACAMLLSPAASDSTDEVGAAGAR